MPVTFPDIFSGDAFSSVTLTDLVNRVYPFVPSYLDGLNLAPGQGMLTLDAAFDTNTGSIRMISTTPRGAPPSQSGYDARSLKRLRAVHMAREVEVNADELLGLRGIGSAFAETLQGLILQRTDGPTGLKVQLAATREHMLLGMIDGVVYDADNATVLYDFYNWAGVARPAPMNIDFTGMTADSGKIRGFTVAIKRAVIAALNGMPAGNAKVVVLCGDNFFDKLDGSLEIMSARKLGVTGSGAPNAIRVLSDNSVYESFEYGNVEFVNYRGSDDAITQVPTNEGRAFVRGVPGLFQTYFAPADTFETVSNVGLPYYLLNLPERQTSKRVVFELQTNPLLACLRPQSLRRVTTSG